MQLWLVPIIYWYLVAMPSRELTPCRAITLGKEFDILKSQFPTNSDLGGQRWGITWIGALHQ